MKQIEAKIVTVGERISLYEKLLVQTRYSLHPETIPTEISHTERSRLIFHRTIKTFNCEEIVVGVLEGDDRYRNQWNIRKYISVPISYYLFVLIKGVGFVFTKEVPVQFNFRQSTFWVISSATLLERNNERISFRLTVTDSAELGWGEEVFLNILLKHEWTRIIKEAFVSYMIQPNKKYDISYEKIDISNFRLTIKDDQQVVHSIILTDTEDNVIEIAQRIVDADCDAPRIGKYVLWSELYKQHFYETTFEKWLIADKPKLVFTGKAKSQ